MVVLDELTLAHFPTAMLRFAEEVLILCLDEARGELVPGLPERSLALALSGAVLMDLALEDRIDTDPKQLVVVDSTPLGDDILDPTLAEIAGADETYDTGYWLERTARRTHLVRKAALERLINRGILRSEAHGLVSLTPSVSWSRRYPISGGQQVEEVRLRGSCGSCSATIFPTHAMSRSLRSRMPAACSALS